MPLPVKKKLKNLLIFCGDFFVVRLSTFKSIPLTTDTEDTFWLLGGRNIPHQQTIQTQEVVKVFYQNYIFREECYRFCKTKTFRFFSNV